MAERQAVRAAPTMDEAFQRYADTHALRKRTGEGDKAMIERHLRPALGRLKVDEVSHADVAAMHAAITKVGSPIAANRAVALASKIFSLAATWEVVTEAGKQPWRSPSKGNPARGIDRNQENKRTRHLDGEELTRLLRVLAERKDASATAIKLALLTGARRGEILGAVWSQFDLKKGTWVKPASLTKQAKEHHLPLSPAALVVLADMRALAEKRAAKRKLKLGLGDYLFPSGDGAQKQLKRCWATVCGAAGLAERVPVKDAKGRPVLGRDGEPKVRWRPSVRYHDLRHTHASMLASGGASLLLIGSLLGHSSPQTTARYAHMLDDPQRLAVARVGAEVEAAEGKRQGAEVADHPKAKRG